MINLFHRYGVDSRRRGAFGRLLLALIGMVVAASVGAGVPSAPSDLATASPVSRVNPTVGMLEQTASSAAHVAVTASPAKVWTTADGKATSAITATFTASNDQPVANAPIRWTTTGGTLSTHTGTTDAAGQARVILTQPSDISPPRELGVIATDADRTSLRSFAAVESCRTESRSIRSPNPAARGSGTNPVASYPR